MKKKKESKMSSEDRLRLLANLLIDKILEDYKQGLLKPALKKGFQLNEK